jgi:HEAT repeat protein
VRARTVHSPLEPMAEDDRKSKEEEGADAADGVARSVHKLFDGINSEGDPPGAVEPHPQGPAEPPRENLVPEDSEQAPPRMPDRRLDDAGYPIIEDLDEVQGFSSLELTLVDEASHDIPVEGEGEEHLLPLGASLGSEVEIEQAVRKLTDSVETFLANPSFDRAQLSRRITGLTHNLREAGRMDAVAEAIEALARGGAEQGGGVYLARTMLSPSIASWIVTRLGLAARDEELRRPRLKAVTRLGEIMAQALGDALVETDDRAQRKVFIDGLIGIGDDARGVVEGMVHDRRWFVVRNALLVMRQVGDEAALVHFTTSLAHEDARVRKEAVLALAHVGGDRAELLALGMLEDADTEVRRATAFALGRLQVERALKPLIQLLEDEEDESVQAEILRALGKLGDPSAVIVLEKHATGTLFRKPSTEMRVAAYHALAEIGTPHAMKLVKGALKDRDDLVRKEAEGILGS